MPKTKPDMDLLALAGITKAGLRDIDSSSVGGNPNADKINIREMAGVDRNRSAKANTPNLLKGMDFVSMPTSRPIGRVDMEGSPLPDIPQNQAIEFAEVPKEIADNVLRQVNNEPNNSVPPPETQPIEEISTIPPEMDFDLFQFSILKDIIKTLDVSISSIEESLAELSSKRDIITKLLKGNTNE